jgi:hypothetical protein
VYRRVRYRCDRRYGPLVSLTDAAVAAQLAPAGLHFVERIRGEIRQPLPPHRGPASCLTEHGRFDSAPVAVDDPGLPAKVNADWWRMASEYGLLNDQREFLLGIYYDIPEYADPDYAWVRVRLDAEWDLVDSRVPVLRSGFAGLLTERFIPEFTMLSIDGQVLLNTTVWGNGTINTIAIRPDRRPDNTT